MKTITNEQLNLFVLCGKAFLNNFSGPKSKLWFAVDKILKIAIKKLKKIETLKNEKRREFAVTLDKGVYDTNENGTFKYNVEGNKKLIAALTEIDQQEVEIDTHIVTEYDDDPKILSFDMRNAFEGIVIPEMVYPE